MKSDDLISRQAAINALRMDISIIPFAKAREYARAVIETIYNRLEDLPSTQPERKTGRWEYIDYGGFGNYHCTACREICICNGDYDFCPNCGAKMGE